MTISMVDIGWTAGFIEGEGNFDFSKTSSFRVRVSQNQRAPLDKLVSLFGGSIWIAKHYTNRHGPQTVHVWSAYGPTAAGLAMMLFPLMSPQRQEQMRRVFGLWRVVNPWKRNRTHCPHGHDYTPANTQIETRRDGFKMRRCRTCRNRAARERRTR